MPTHIQAFPDIHRFRGPGTSRHTTLDSSLDINYTNTDTQRDTNSERKIGGGCIWENCNSRGWRGDSVVRGIYYLSWFIPLHPHGSPELLAAPDPEGSKFFSGFCRPCTYTCVLTHILKPLHGGTITCHHTHTMCLPHCAVAMTK